MNQVKKKVFRILFNYIFIYVKPKPKIVSVAVNVAVKPLSTPPLFVPVYLYEFSPLVAAIRGVPAIGSTEVFTPDSCF